MYIKEFDGIKYAEINEKIFINLLGEDLIVRTKFGKITFPDSGFKAVVVDRKVEESELSLGGESVPIFGKETGVFLVKEGKNKRFPFFPPARDEVCIVSKEVARTLLIYYDLEGRILYPEEPVLDLGGRIIGYKRLAYFKKPLT